MADQASHYGESDNRDRSLNVLSEEELMSRVQRGDGDAFAVIFDRYNRLVLTVALKIVRDAAEAQEVTQNVFLEFYRSARRFDPARGTLKVWLLQFAYHRSINRRNYLLLRQFYNHSGLEEAEAWETSSPSTPHMSAQELKRLIAQALATLNAAQRRAIERVMFEGLTLREVAEETGESYSAVRNHYYRGLDRLRSCLSPSPSAARSDNLFLIGEVSRGKA